MDQEPAASAPKKPRLVFTDLQRRTLQAIFKVITRSNLLIDQLFCTYFSYSIVSLVHPLLHGGLSAYDILPTPNIQNTAGHGSDE